MNFKYSHEKNALLLKEREIGFEEIIESIDNGNLIKIMNHHDRKKYPNQYILYVVCLGKVYLVPCVKEKRDTLFLKTLYPSRKATKELLK